MKNKGIWLVIISIIIAGIVITMSTNFFVKNQRGLEYPAAEATVSTRETKSETGSSEADIAAGGAAPVALLEDDAQPEAAVEGEATPQAQMDDAPTEAVMETLARAEIVRSPLESEEAPGAPLPAAVNSAGKTGGKTSVTIGPDYRVRLDELGVQIQKIREEGTESTTYSLKTAAENELKLWDSELNLIYNDLLSYMSDEEDLKLIEGEREWMKARDAAAVDAAKKSAGGTLEGLEYTASLAESTKQRAYELADIYVETIK